MAHEIHTTIDADGAPTDGQTKYDNWYSNHNFVLTDREQAYTENLPRDDGTLQGYHEFRVYLSLQDDLQTAISDLENQFPDASWMVVHTRRNDSELEQDPLKSDETYYDPTLSDGLRADVDIGFDGHTLEHGDLHYVAGGTEHTISADSYEFAEPDNVVETTLYADLSEQLNESSGVKIADIEVHPGRIVNIQEASQPTTFNETWTKEVTRGTPPDHFSDKSVAFPDPLNPKPVDRVNISQTTQDALTTARDNNDVQGQLDHILDVLDVIDL